MGFLARLAGAALILCAAAGGDAVGQSSPGFVGGQIITSASLNDAFKKKADYPPQPATLTAPGVVIPDGSSIVICGPNATICAANPFLPPYQLGTAPFPVPLTGSVLQLLSPSGTATALEIDSYGMPSLLRGAHFGGTAGSPVPLVANEEMLSLNAWGNTGFNSNAQGPAGGVSIYADENWQAGKQGTKVCLRTTVNGTTTIVTNWCVGNAGGLTYDGLTPQGPGTINALAYYINNVLQPLGLDANFGLNGSNLLALANCASGQLIANSGASSAEPACAALSAVLDRVFGSTQGGTLYRDNAGWAFLGPGTSGQTLTSGGPAANPSWTTPSSAAIVPPQGRLTLVTGTPILVSNQTAKSQIFYTAYIGNAVAYFNGSSTTTETIPGNEVSDTVPTSGTGVANASDVFDLWWVHGGANRLCHATNGSGGGWASDTGGSTTARGTGYSALTITKGFYTNTNAITHCYNGATDYGSVAANQATYLGSFYTTAAGQTGMAFTPAAAAGGSAPILGLFNAYNRVPIETVDFDSNGSWTYATATWRPADNNNNNRVSFVDGLSVMHVGVFGVQLVSGGGGQNCYIGANQDAITGAPLVQGETATGNAENVAYSASFMPLFGFHYIQSMEFSTGATCTFFSTSSGGQIFQLRARLFM